MGDIFEASKGLLGVPYVFATINQRPQTVIAHDKGFRTPFPKTKVICASYSITRMTAKMTAPFCATCSPQFHTWTLGVLLGTVYSQYTPARRNGVQYSTALLATSRN